MNIASDNVRVMVFADDGEPPADAAWAWIGSHPWTGWSLEVLSVQETVFPGGPVVGPSGHVVRRPSDETRFAQYAHIDAVGDPRTVLHGRLEASLIVVGCHHRGHLAGLLAGSTTEWLLTRPRVPLVVARHGHRTESVTICLDGSSHAQYAFETYLSVPWAHEPSISLVSVADGSTDTDTALREAAVAFPQHQQPELVSLTGSPRHAITHFVRTRGSDLVVLGTRGLVGLERLAVGSTVSALVKDQTANLLVAYGVNRSEVLGT